MTSKATQIGISGSYSRDDCIFLLKELDLELLSVDEKEKRLQAGVHYSEMVSIENPPSAEYTRLFLKMLDKYKQRLAQEIAALAAHIHQHYAQQQITLLSLARAGTPIGILLHRTLKYKFLRDSQHYSISIIRDKGLDTAAIRHVLQQNRSPSSILFVDGWTAKGVITRELKQSVADWNKANPEQLNDTLCVISDIGGTADIVATSDDYVIPSGIMNSTVSGLVSRTVRTRHATADQFHGCMIYHHLASVDYSNLFIDQIYELINTTQPNNLPHYDKTLQHQQAQAYVQYLQKHYEILDINKIKPGIAEATRVMLRRIPRLLLLKNLHLEDIQHLKILAQEKNIPIHVDPNMPFNATALIKELEGEG